MDINDLQIKSNIPDIIKFLDSTFDDAIKKGASDIHIEPNKNFVLIRFRIDGGFILYDKLSLEFFSSIVTRLKILASIKIDESRIPQDGKILFKYKAEDNIEDIDIRVSTLPTNAGEKVVMRILRQNASMLGLDKLKFLDENLLKIKECLKSKHGIILVAGPTGSGKSTTLFSLLKYFNPLEKNISTLEDPVEYNIDYINQSQISPQKGFTFASGLRSLLRQDPDIIMVGEMRDKETSTLSIEAALTGHLVLSTIHTNSAPGTIQRLLNMGIEPFLIGSALKMIISQRLVRKICPNCKKEHNLDIETKQKVTSIINGIIDENIENISFYKGVGCELCNFTGYKGRIGVHEVLLMNRNLESSIINNAPESEIKNIAISNGMITISQDAIIKCILGETTIDEALLLN